MRSQEFKGKNLIEILPEVGDYRIEVSVEQAIESIRASLPDFPLKSIELFGGGLSNAVFLVNDQYVFRFPRNERANKALAREVAFQPQLQSISLAIPRIELTGQQIHNGLNFAAYRMLPGESATKEAMYDDPNTPNARNAERLGKFLHEMHSLDTEEAERLGLEKRDLKTWHERLRQHIQSSVYPVLRRRFPAIAEAMIEKAEDAFDRYLGDEENFNFAYRVIHGDLEQEHILVDLERREISGIIDFGGIRISDPDYDFWRPYFHFGKPFVDEMLKAYRHPDPELLYRKMEFFWTEQVLYRLMRAILVEGEDSERTGRHLEYVKKRLQG